MPDLNLFGESGFQNVTKTERWNRKYQKLAKRVISLSSLVDSMLKIKTTILKILLGVIAPKTQNTPENLPKVLSSDWNAVSMLQTEYSTPAIFLSSSL